MVGVVVAMVISTMHEKSCIDSHNARVFEKSSKIQSFTHHAITMMKLREYRSHEFIKLSKLYNAIIQIVDLVTPESLWRHKGVAMHVTYKTMHRFSTMHDSPPPASEFRLQISAS